MPKTLMNLVLISGKAEKLILPHKVNEMIPPKAKHAALDLVLKFQGLTLTLPSILQIIVGNNSCLIIKHCSRTHLASPRQLQISTKFEGVCGGEGVPFLVATL